MQLRFYSVGTPQQYTRVDRANKKLLGVVAMLGDREAIGHNLLSDQKTLAKMQEIGNKRGTVKVRFGHPAMSENATGKYLGKANNFKIVDNALLHDIQFDNIASKSPVFAKDPIDYLMSIAEQSPSAIGMSVVINANTVWIDNLGNEFSTEDYPEKPEFAVNYLPLIRPIDFTHSDFVSEGALTDSLFMQEMTAGTSSEFANMAYRALDEFSTRYKLTTEQVYSKVNLLVNSWCELKERGNTAKIHHSIGANKIYMDNDNQAVDVDNPAKSVSTVLEGFDLALDSNQEQDVFQEQLSAMRQEYQELFSVLEGKYKSKFDAMQADVVKLAEALVQLSKKHTNSTALNGLQANNFPAVKPPSEDVQNQKTPKGNPAFDFKRNKGAN